MASSINPSNIDGTYPVAGQDNDSQGFRDNFTNTKNNFTYAKAELEDLQNKVLVKEPLTGQTVDGNFNNLQRAYGIKGAIISDQVLLTSDFGTTSGTININHQTAHWQTVTTDGATSLTFSGFLSGKICTVLLAITIADVSHTLTLPDLIYLGAIDLPNYDPVAEVFTFAKAETYWLRFTSDDGGASFLIEDVTNNKLYHYSANLATGSNLTAHTLDLSAPGTERTALEANANVAISYSNANVVTGKEVKMFVTNLLGSNISVILPDTTNNLAALNFGISTLATATMTFTAMDNSNTNVYCTIVTG